LVRLVTVALVAVLRAVAVCPPEDVTVYPVMGESPVLGGAVQVTVADAFPPVAGPMVGAPGSPTA
jgi:hypothetical protein